MKWKKQSALVCPIDAIGASACPMAVFSGFYESPGSPLLGDVRSIKLPHHNDHQSGHQSGYIIHCFFVCYRPGSHWGDMERSFMKALDLLHQAMCAVLHHRTAMTIEKAYDGGAFVCCRQLF